MASNIIKKQNDLIKGAFKTAIATVALYVGLTSCSKSGAIDFVLKKWDNRFNDKRIEIMQELEDETGINTDDNENAYVLYAVLKNSNLEDWEKNLLYDFDSMLKDNPYINLSRSYKALENLDIIYTTRPDEYKDTVYGVYNPDENTIRMFQNEEQVNIDILKHELIHSVFKYSYNSLPDFFVEGTTEILANEYFSDFPFIETKTYPFEVEMVELLCDMVGSDTVLKAYTKGDMNIIILELAKTMGIKESHNFIIDIEDLFASFENGEKIDKAEFERIMKNANSFIANKYKDNSDQIVADKLFYTQELLSNMLEDKPYECYWEFLEENGTFTKVYFNKDLKAKTELKRINIDNSEYDGPKKVYTYAS